ncbi:hypothetical protein [Streptosporangium vulgare]|uniref:hypothetical protein n=1 Tax=Streptosporangium vulgare TaxID=46190 RepID=UPI0031D569FB
MVEKLIRPFLSGVVLERESWRPPAVSSTSSGAPFARGTVGVPAPGMGEIPRQLAPA